MPAVRGPRTDPYELLGVSAHASSADITRAYRRLARALHPGSRPSDPAAADQFRALALAYELLSDPARRAAYDQQYSGPAARAWPPVTPRQGQAMPPIWPLDPAVTERPVAAPRPTDLLAGPVTIEPLPGRGPGDLGDLIRRLVTRWAGGPW
jgi:hypothetical protein